ncbi:hypothetical protein MFM001_16860 [Mycobacterium sp. MFM001]|nr:hypothetical protein MFM001_16860 [Mycobacterium sp. MFM001]
MIPKWARGNTNAAATRTNPTAAAIASLRPIFTTGQPIGTAPHDGQTFAPVKLLDDALWDA